MAMPGIDEKANAALLRCTDRARKTLQLAVAEAKRLGHPGVCDVHILLGILKEGYGVAANVLKNLDVDFRQLKAKLEEIRVPKVPGAWSQATLPLDPVGQLVLAEADKLRGDCNYVGTEHLLLALVAARTPRGSELFANLVLAEFGCSQPAIEAEVALLLGSATADPSPANVTLRLNLRVHDAKAILAYANSKVEDWDMRGDEFGPADLGQAVYETVVLNEVPKGLLDVGLELVDYRIETTPKLPDEIVGEKPA